MNLPFPLTRRLIVFDTETTGPNPETDRIVELGFTVLYPDGRDPLRWSSLINPGIPIPREATFGNGSTYPGHGITDAHVQGCRTCGWQHITVDHFSDDGHDFRPWPKFAQVAANLLSGFTDSDFAGFNVKSFDLPLMRAEFAREGHAWSYSTARIIDGYRNWQIGQPRSLSDAVEYFLHRKHEGAHRVIDDVDASLAVIIAQFERYAVLPRDVQQMHDLAFPVDPNAIDPDGKIVWKDGIAVMTFGKHIGKDITKVDRGYWDFVANKADHMSPEMRQIARDAIMGKFPTRQETLI